MMMMFVVVALVALLSSSSIVSASSLAANSTTMPHFDRVFVMVFENHGYLETLLNKYWARVVDNGMLLTDYHAITHPSQPNYVSMLAGDTLGCDSDSDFTTDKTSLVDLLEKKGVSYKGYMQSYEPLKVNNATTSCNPVTSGGDGGLYYRKHNPFMSFSNIRNNAERCQHIVPASQLDIDVANDALPQFSFFTPNINNDSHNQDLNFSGKWLTQWLDTHLNEPKFINNTLFLITFDEDERLEGNHIITIAYGGGGSGGRVAPGGHTKSGGKYNHFSITRLIEDNWQLGSLGRHDATAHSLIDVVRQQEPSKETAHQMGRRLQRARRAKQQQQRMRKK